MGVIRVKCIWIDHIILVDEEKNVLERPRNTAGDAASGLA
jgi:hypothetical protein